MPDPPVRDRPTPTRCTCRLRVEWTKSQTTRWDSCPGYTSGPDEPVCRECVSAGHPEAHNFDPIIKPN
jgi:hypothetical protein